ncbi:MAG TPA: hypothetical protein VF173_27795 [Thermoanaerobaculia bacterium]|nr:hypothetical protein [Thermoanaerobaculia bacterium]
MRKHLVAAVLITVLCLVFALPAVAADRTIRGGIDIWATKADGRTQYSFASEPIPSGFFCSNSAPFTGTVFLKGMPLATGTPGDLGNADTIVQRLDDVAFEKSNVTSTRIQLRALNLVSIAPIKTSCGLYNVKAFLDGDQPVTRMRIVRETPTSGTYSAPLALNVKMVFTPVNDRFARPVALRKSLHFKPAPNARWTSQPPAELLSHTGFVKVDTDGDGVPDTYIEGTTRNFSAAGPNAKSAGGTCHCADDACSEMHCTNGVIMLMVTDQ